MMALRIYIGTAGWSIPRASAHRCPTEGTHLQRYARVFPCTEINSSFHRPHAESTHAKWAASTPDAFQFAVKVPRLITHDLKLLRTRRPFDQFLAESSGLGHQRGPLLVQLPPSFAFDARVAARFFDVVRTHYHGNVVCEPRHPTWFAARPHALMQRFAVARVVADPPITAGAHAPGGWDGIAYFRLHGTPRMYWSRYDASYLSRLAISGSAAVRIGRRVVCLRQHRDWCGVRQRMGPAAASREGQRLGSIHHIGAPPSPCTPAFPIAHRRVGMALCCGWATTGAVVRIQPKGIMSHKNTTDRQLKLVIGSSRERTGVPELDLVCFSHLRWDFVYQRPQHLLSRAAQSRRVLFVEEPHYDAVHPSLETRRDPSGVTIAVPHLPRDAGAVHLQTLLNFLLSAQDITDFVAWYLHADGAGLHRASYSRSPWSTTAWTNCRRLPARHRSSEKERALLMRADLVLTGRPVLFEAKSPLTSQHLSVSQQR